MSVGEQRCLWMRFKLFALMKSIYGRIHRDRNSDRNLDCLQLICFLYYSHQTEFLWFQKQQAVKDNLSYFNIFGRLARVDAKCIFNSIKKIKPFFSANH